VAKRSGVKVETFSIGFGPTLFKKSFKDTEYRISLIPLGGYVKLAGEIKDENTTGAEWEFISKPVWKRFLILTAGPVSNYLLSIIIFIVVFTIGIPRLSTEIGKTLEDYPAEKAGIEEFDKVIEVEGEKVIYWEEMVGLIRKSEDKVINLKVYRPEVGELNFSVESKLEEKENFFGQKTTVPIIGIYPSGKTVSIDYSFLQAIVKGINYVGYLTYVTVEGIWNIIIGNISFKQAATGPLGIYHITTEAAKAGITYLLYIIAVISMSLAIINLFPFPVLDGGHVLFLLIEKTRGKPLSPKVQQIAMQIGMYVLIVLMLYLIYIDYIRFQ